MANGRKITSVLAKALLLSMAVTLVLLAVLALLVYLLHFNDGKMNIGIVVVYILSCLFSGFAAGKGVGDKKFLWGAVTGLLYFIVIVIVSFAMSHGTYSGAVNYLTTVLLCAGSGMLGGMLS